MSWCTSVFIRADHLDLLDSETIIECMALDAEASINSAVIADGFTHRLFADDDTVARIDARIIEEAEADEWDAVAELEWIRDSIRARQVDHRLEAIVSPMWSEYQTGAES